MGGNLGELVDELTARFNDSQDEIVVTPTFQGSYDDTYNALLAAFETGGEPNIIQNFDLASQTMMDTGRLVPAWQLMQEEGYDARRLRARGARLLLRREWHGWVGFQQQHAVDLLQRRHVCRGRR